MTVSRKRENVTGHSDGTGIVFFIKPFFYDRMKALHVSRFQEHGLTEDPFL